MTASGIHKIETILAIDPGTRKAGLAVIQSDGSVLDKRIIRDFADFKITLKRTIQIYKPSVMVIGNGTGFGIMRMIIEPMVGNAIPIETVDEKGSSEEARKEYMNRFRFLKRFVMTIAYILGFWKMELDDDVAVIIGKRFLSSKK
jgi:RNase H-fold protein (predicted Holliday junction resolvase)